MAISFIGSAEGSSSANTDTTLTLPSMEAGDLVVVAYAIGDDDNVNHNLSMVTAGYTEVADLFSNDTDDTNLGVFWKIMGATPDSTAVCNALGGTDAAVAGVAMVFRGVDIDSPMDVTPATATGTNGFNPDPPSLNHNNPSGVWTVIAGASGHTLGGAGTYTFPTGYTTNAIDRGHDDTNDITVGMGYRSSGVSDPENPGVMTHSGTSATENSWAAVTMALRPALSGFGIKRQSVTQAAWTSGGAVAYTTSVQSGNLLVVGFGRDTNSTPTVTDTQSNTWAVARSHYDATNDYRADLWYAVAGSTGANSVTVTATNTVTGALILAEYGGPYDATPLDSNTNSATGTSSTPSSGNITPSVNNTHVVGYIEADSAQTAFTAGSGFTADRIQNAGTITDALLESLVQGAAGAQDADGTLSGSFGWTALVVAFQPEVVGFTLAVDAGSYVVTGSTASTLADRLLPAVAGTYALTGFAAALSKGFILNAETGLYQLTGSAATFIRDLVLQATAGSYAITGEATILKAARIFSAEAGSYAVVGSAATLIYTPVGQFTLVADSGAYVVTGQAASVLAARLLAAGAGVYVVTGTDANLVYTPVGGTGTYTMIHHHHHTGA